MTAGEREEKLSPEALERLNVAVRESGGPAEISRVSGEPLRTVNLYLAGQADPKLSKINRILQACGKTLDWLLTGNESPGSAISVANDEFAVIHRYDVKASASRGATVYSPETTDAFAFRRDWLRKLGVRPEAAAIITGTGDSMEPTISDGDPLLVDLSVQEVRNGAIYALSVDGELLVKRLQLRIDGSVAVISDNPKYATEEIPRDRLDDLRIIGRVRWGGHEL